MQFEFQLPNGIAQSMFFFETAQLLLFHFVKDASEPPMLSYRSQQRFIRFAGRHQSNSQTAAQFDKLLL